jgi:hypothetical protein
LRSSAALGLLLAGLKVGPCIDPGCQGFNPLCFGRTVGVGPGCIIGATAALGSALAATAFAAVIAFSTLTSFAISARSFRTRLIDRCI